jgi:hypothetical protein
MNCKHIWNREFIDLHLSKNFRIKDYRKHRENVLFEREKSFFQETLELMEKNQEQKQYCQDKIKTLTQEKKELQIKINQLNHQLHSFRYNFNLLDNTPTKIIDNFDIANERKNYIKKCITDDCRGYINNKGHCHLCKLIICMQCYEPKTDNHECKQENIDSVQQIKKDTKLCPKCNTSIYKIDGCRQMWCTICHTAFDWKTGQIIHHRIHNPHFYEWQKNQEKMEIEFNHCNEQELPNLSRLRVYLSNINTDFQTRKKLFDIHRSINHMIDIDMHDLQMNIDNPFDLNINYRVSYLKSYINETEYKNLLILKENKIERNKNLFLLYEMISKTMIMFFNEIFQLNKQQIESELLLKINSLLEYSNTQLDNHCKRFNIKKLHFRDDFMIVRN